LFITPPAETLLKRAPITAGMTSNLLTVSLSSDTSLANLLKRSLITDVMNANLLKVVEGSIPDLDEFAENRPAIDDKFSEDA
jgi:hypothetical protein